LNKVGSKVGCGVGFNADLTYATERREYVDYVRGYVAIDLGLAPEDRNAVSDTDMLEELLAAYVFLKELQMDNDGDGHNDHRAPQGAA